MAGTISQSRSKVEIGSGSSARRCDVVTVDFVADAADGSVPVLSVNMRGFLLKVVTNPGATAPTANWDIALQDPADSALDAAGGLLANRHTTNSEQVYPLVTGAACPIFLAGDYGVAVSGNSVNSATGRIVFYLIDSI